MGKQEFVTNDWSIASFLSLKPDLRVIPFREERGRVAFRVEGDAEPALEEYFSNTPIPIQDFVRATKQIRQSMFLLKGRKGVG